MNAEMAITLETIAIKREKKNIKIYIVAESLINLRNNYLTKI